MAITEADLESIFNENLALDIDVPVHVDRETFRLRRSVSDRVNLYYPLTDFSMNSAPFENLNKYLLHFPTDANIGHTALRRLANIYNLLNQLDMVYNTQLLQGLREYLSAARNYDIAPVTDELSNQSSEGILMDASEFVIKIRTDQETHDIDIGENINESTTIKDIKDLVQARGIRCDLLQQGSNELSDEDLFHELGIEAGATLSCTVVDPRLRLRILDDTEDTEDSSRRDVEFEIKPDSTFGDLREALNSMGQLYEDGDIHAFDFVLADSTQPGAPSTVTHTLDEALLADFGIGDGHILEGPFGHVFEIRPADE